ncbi:MAG: UDP-N-acetylmuramoyl-L-alanine--D-glutamate ligase [Verrucomicrobia bacterium]|nr:UDP-N-acetylmuramoyl-L-alanine--D-glutamate ligase [Verrucomicrobiota bacterium]
MPLTAPEFLRPLLNRPVAVLGGGVVGEKVLRLVEALGAEGKIYDARGADFTAGAARQHGLAVFSPAFAPDHPWLARARAAGVECLGELDFAAACWRGRLVAVSGTNGKTTVTEFLAHALSSLGRVAQAIGAPGHPLAELVVTARGGSRDAIALCEVSSAQAETLRHLRSDGTLWINFAEDHLERHGGLEAYFGAKWNLVAHTAPGLLFAGSSVARFAQKFGRPLPAAAVVASEGQPGDARLARSALAAYPQRENFLLAAAWWRAAGYDEAALIAAARTFKLGRHRLARVVEHDGVEYWNDAKATNFLAVEAALGRFTAPVVLIAGGKSKGGDLAGFVHRIAPRVKHVVLLGSTGADLAFHCATFRVAHSVCGTLAEAVRRAAELAAPGEHVVFSPGFASFDMFRNFEDRGDQFEKLVRELAASAASLR